MGKWLGPPHEEISRCGAKTRSGGMCGHYSMKNGRCRYHGGKSTGATKPYRNVKHGFYSKDAIKVRGILNDFLKISKQTIIECKTKSEIYEMELINDKK
jgi:hypothetical protein